MNFAQLEKFFEQKLNDRTCGKVSFKQVNRAKSASDKLALDIYRCSDCGRWHLTSSGLAETKYGKKR